MEQTYCMPTLRILLIESEDVVRTSGVGRGEEFQTNGQYDGSNIWNGF